MGTFKTQMLWESIQKGDLTATIGLLQSGNINLEERDENGQTFLMMASEFGELNIVRELLEANVDINAVDKDNWSALLYSAKEGHIEIVIELLERGANIEHLDLSGWTALMWASYKGKDLVVQELLDRGANPNVKAELNMTSLAWAAGRGHTKVVQLLLQKGAKINSSDKYGTTPLIWASRKGYLEIVEALLNEGASVDVVGMNSWTPLLVATKGGFSEVVHQILEYDPNVNTLDKDGFTALTLAAKEGIVNIVHDLLARGAYVNLADRAGDTILIHAVKGGHTEIVRALINKYADVDVAGVENKTALYWAVEKGHVEIVRSILGNEPDLEIATKDGDTALLRAVRNRNEQCVRLLLDKGSKVSAVDKRGDTALHISLRARSKRITELLLRNPRNSRLLYRPNKSGETPYNIDVYHQRQILTQIFGHRNLNANDGENLLGYDIYSSALADILSEPSLNTPITIGLYAKWGSGKSFLLNKMQKEMKSFTVANRDEHFTFCWTLFIILLLINNVIGLTLALADRWEVGLGVGIGLFPVEYLILGVIHLLTNRYSFRVAEHISLLLGRKLMVLTLLLKVLFFNPKHKQSQKFVEPSVRFLFSESTKLTSVGGEKALAAMIGTLGDSLEREYGMVVARLFRVFKPHPDKPYTGRFKSLCCIPYFIIVYIVFLAIEVGIYLLVSYRLYHPSTTDVDTAANSTTTAPPSSQFGGLMHNTPVYAVLITIGCIVVLAIISNIYTWGQAFLALLQSQKKRIIQAADQIGQIKMDGLMQKLKYEVDLMGKLVSCMDRFMQNQTRLVVIVDGLDSCEQDKVMQVLDIIKALFSDEDSPFITVLAIDPQVIIKGIESNMVKSRLNYQDTNVNGFDYLRNVVHLPFYLQSQGMDIKKQELAPSGSVSNVSKHGKDSPTKSQRNYQHQDSGMSSTSIYEPRRKRGRNDSLAQSLHSNFDLTNSLTKTDYFSDINPRSVRRLMNIVAVTGRILRAYNIDFSWHRLASWINIVEQWPYRVSWIIFYFEEHEMVDNNLSLHSIYERIESKIPISKEVEPLLEIDRNPRKLEANLASKSANNTMLNVGDVKKFLPCTINLDPYLRKLIRELEKNNDIARTDFPMGTMYTGGPPPGTPGAPGPNQVTKDMTMTPTRRITQPRGNMYPSPMEMSLQYQQMYPYSMMMPFYQPLPGMSKAKAACSTSKLQDPNNLINDYQNERLSLLDVDQICHLLPRLKGINQNKVGVYQASIQDNNISGLVLSTCDLEELGKVMGMQFGDWQLFKSAMTALRMKEEEENSEDVTDFFSDYQKINDAEEDTHSTGRHRSSNSESDSISDDVVVRPKHQQVCRQSSIDSSKNNVRISDRGKFETITEEKEISMEASKGVLKRKDSAIQQMEFESGILHNAMMMSFAEEDEEEEDDDDNDQSADKLIQPSGSKVKETKPVRFTLGNADHYPDEDDTSPLLKNTQKSALIDLSSQERGSKLSLKEKNSIKLQHLNGSDDSVGFQTSAANETERVIFVDEIHHASSVGDLSRNRSTGSDFSFSKRSSAPLSTPVEIDDVWILQSSEGQQSRRGDIQMVTYSSDRKSEEREDQV